MCRRRGDQRGRVHRVGAPASNRGPPRRRSRRARPRRPRGRRRGPLAIAAAAPCAALRSAGRRRRSDATVQRSIVRDREMGMTTICVSGDGLRRRHVVPPTYGSRAISLAARSGDDAAQPMQVAARYTVHVAKHRSRSASRGQRSRRVTNRRVLQAIAGAESLRRRLRCVGSRQRCGAGGVRWRGGDTARRRVAWRYDSQGNGRPPPPPHVRSLTNSSRGRRPPGDSKRFCIDHRLDSSPRPGADAAARAVSRSAAEGSFGDARHQPAGSRT